MTPKEEARALQVAGEYPTDRHSYAVHVAFDCLDDYDIDDILDHGDLDLDDAPLFEVVGELTYNPETDSFE